MRCRQRHAGAPQPPHGANASLRHRVGYISSRNSLKVSGQPTRRPQYKQVAYESHYPGTNQKGPADLQQTDSPICSVDVVRTGHRTILAVGRLAANYLSF